MMKSLYILTFVVFVTGDISHLQSGGRSFPSLYGSISPGQHIRILQSESDIHPNGNYRFAFKTENGISAEEVGVQGANGPEGGTSVKGSYQYTSPEGVPVLVGYSADQNGFRPESNILPTPPPIPLPIVRSIQYIADHHSPQ